MGRKRLHFGCNDRKAPAGFAGARGFDCRVQRKQIGLIRHSRNQLHDFTDTAGGDGPPGPVEPPYFLSPFKSGWKVIRETAPTPG